MNNKKTTAKDAILSLCEDKLDDRHTQHYQPRYCGSQPADRNWGEVLLV
ncbi:MAG: hypothetical protein IPJ52_07200 [Rhodocyclaceae bacterium]|nr:hypothetical protein [Rhodocyclaceae bacterium]